MLKLRKLQDIKHSQQGLKPQKGEKRFNDNAAKCGKKAYKRTKMFQNTIFFAPSDIKSISSYAHRMNDERKSGEVGYYHLFDGEDALVSEVESFMSAKKHIKKVVLVGMGGSSCGVKALRDFLCFDKRGGAELFIIDNTDTSTFERLLAFASLENTLFIISSKTGTTIEVLTLFKLIIKHFNIERKGLCEHFAFITDKGSKLHELALEIGVKCFFIPQNVGGRFSVLSAIGIVPALLCGYDARSLLAGARTCHDEFFGGKNDIILQKAYHFCTHKNAHSNVLFSYADAFKGFNEWYVQLIAESLGKKQGFKRVGITPIALVGARDQHSFLQLIMEGPKDKTITFLKVLESYVDFGEKFEKNSQNFKNSKKIHANSVNLNENSQNTSPQNASQNSPQNTFEKTPQNVINPPNELLKTHPNAHTFSSQEHISKASFYSPIVPDFSLPHLESYDFVGGVSLQSLLNAQCDATLQSLLAENLSIDLITLGAADAWHLGYLMFYCELLTSACGIMLGINTYDQPGVELGKLILKKMLEK